MLKFLDELERCKRESRRGIIATIIRIEGSSYQKEGTKCFYTEDGKLTGILSGGCVEGDVIEHAKEVLETNRPKKLYYDFREEDQIWGLGVGCNGAIEVFLEIFDPMAYSMESHLIEKAYASTKDIIIATITNSHEAADIGHKWIISSESEMKQDNQLHMHLNNYPVSLEKKSVLCHIDNVEIFFDYIEPIPEVFIFGAGPDAIPLVKNAKNMGWKVKVADHRPGFLNSMNFSDADELVSYPRGVVPDIPLSENTYCVVMSHHFNQDQLVLEKILTSSVTYVGVLGPTKRTKQLIGPLLMKFSPEDIKFDRLYSPVGLDIGAKTPEEIAISITSEIISVHRAGRSKHLKETGIEDFMQGKEAASEISH